MRISLFVPDLRGGGAERVCLLLAKEFLRRGHSLEVVLLQKQGVFLDLVPPVVTVVDLSAARVRKGFQPLVQYLNESRPDVLLASMWPLTTLAVLASKVARFKGKVIACEHSVLSRSPVATGLSGFALKATMRWVNSHADAVVGVSDGVIEDLRRLGLPAGRGVTIHNPVELLSESEFVQGDWSEHRWFQVDRWQRLLAVGALKPAKDYATLLRAIRLLKNSGQQVELLILGTGPLKEDLCRQREAMGLSDVVHFGGFVPNPSPFYRAAGQFVLSSAWEGFGNVIVEALGAGTPVVATDCPCGPAEILAHGNFGSLVPVGDEAALARAIETSLHSRCDSGKLRRRAADFSPERAADRYLEIFSV